VFNVSQLTSQKITATNTWNFALIDYFHDLTLLRNGPDDQSINFQKASCTLDGCVKIWTSRVDSVATETGKLLSGLAGGGGGGDDGDDVDGEDDESGEPKAARKVSLANIAV
jgi:condensin complex subunit 2